MKLRRAWVAAVATIFVAAGCSGDGDGSAPASFPRQTIAVQVDATGGTVPVSFTSYFPGVVKAHAGDTVVFSRAPDGGPHTITLGTRVDAALAASAKARSEGTNREPPELAALPRALPAAGAEVDPVAAGPCFLPEGSELAGDTGGCRAGQQPDFDGRQAFFSSGLLDGGATFSLKLAEDITTGAYGFICLLHRGDMFGQISVVEPDVAVPAPGAVARLATEQRDFLVSRLKLSLDAASTDGGGAGQVLAGLGRPDTPGATADAFLPTSTSVPVGGTVAWTLAGRHTISFNVSEDQPPLLARMPDGAWRANRRFIDAIGGPGVEQAVVPPDSPPDATATIDSGNWDGVGERSSGLLVSTPLAPLIYRVSFTRPGTYPYRCLVRPTMAGTVVVG